MVDARHHGFPARSLIIYEVRGRVFMRIDFGIDKNINSSIENCKVN